MPPSISPTTLPIAKASYASEPITCLLNISDINWNAGHDLNKMFAPPPKDHKGNTNFSHFTNLKTANYRGLGVFAQAGRKTILDEFFKPDKSAPPSKSLDEDKSAPVDIQTMVDPAGQLEKWRAVQPAD